MVVAHAVLRAACGVARSGRALQGSVAASRVAGSLGRWWRRSRAAAGSRCAARARARAGKTEPRPQRRRPVVDHDVAVVLYGEMRTGVPVRVRSPEGRGALVLDDVAIARLHDERVLPAARCHRRVRSERLTWREHAARW